MRVLSTADDDGVDGDQDGQRRRQDRLHRDQNHARHGLGRLRDAELVDEDEDADDRQHAHDLDHDVDPLAGLGRVRPTPQQEHQHQGLDDQLAGRLEQAVPVARRDDAASREHVHDHGHEQPPPALLVLIVEEAVLAPRLLVLEERLGVALGLLEPPRELPYAEGEEAEHGSEGDEGHAGQRLGAPRVAVRELIDAVERPDAVEHQDHADDRPAHEAPVPLAEAGQAFGEGGAQGPQLEDEFEDQDADDDGGDDDGEDHQDRHEHVRVRDGQLGRVSLDALDEMRVLGVGLGRVFAAGEAVERGLGSVDAGGDVASQEPQPTDEGVEAALRHAAAAGRAVVVDERYVPQVRDAVGREISARDASEAVDGRLHVVPRHEPTAEAKVLGKAAIDGRVVDAEHAVQGHGLHPAQDLAEAGARRRSARSGESGADRAESRHAGQEQGRAGHADGDVRHGRDDGGLAIVDRRLDAGQVRAARGRLELQFRHSVEVRQLEGYVRDQTGKLVRDLLRALCGEVADGY